ncbi:MAG: hypothetical protein FWE26_05170 [Coriobacteriia bacterium]|nr:hypothetical protein [Coriobacteriia bacterium]MCL2870999.1 hypothetical protein [Coriobacteriia bacterium]
MDVKKILKAIGPLLLLAIPAIILWAIFSDSHYDTNIGAYEAEGEVTYSLTDPERYGLTGEETPSR